MQYFSATRQLLAKPKVKLWLCGFGVVIAILVVALMPPLSKNNSAGLKIPATAKSIDTALNSVGERGYVIQTAEGSGQASTSAIQGSLAQPKVVTTAQNADSAAKSSAAVCDFVPVRPVNGCGQPNCQAAGGPCDRCSLGRHECPLGYSE